MEFYLHETQPKKIFSCNATNNKQTSKKLLAEGKTKSPPGLRKRPNRMSSDKMFLRNLAPQLSDMDITGPWGESVTNKAQLRFERNPSVHKLFLNMWGEQNNGRHCFTSFRHLSSYRAKPLTMRCKIHSPHTCF